MRLLIYAAWSGKVIAAAMSGVQGYGSWIVIAGDVEPDGKTKYTYTYGHPSKIVVSTDDYVKTGQLIGYIGAEGDSTGAHLHLQINRGSSYSNNNTVNPTDVIGSVPTLKMLQQQIKEREESESSGGKTTGTEWPGTKTASSI